MSKIIIRDTKVDENMIRQLTNNNKFQRCIYQSLFSFIRTQNAAPNLVAARNIAQNLPRLPVPKLEQTFDKYLKTVRPFLNDNEFAATTRLVKDFISDNGLGQKIQKYLVEKANNTENWLSDWWINTAYLDFRSPVVVWSSPGLVFPHEKFTDENDRLEFTSKMILAALDYKLKIDEDLIPLDKMGKDLLDMNQYKRVFGTCRIPGLKRDGMEFNPSSKHIVVAHNNHFFKINVFDKDNKVLSKRQLITLLNDILLSSEERAQPIGILTTEHRDNWGRVYQHLIKDPANKKSVNEIQKSLFLICLDGPMPTFESETRSTTASKQCIHGGGSLGNAGNRWYDKTIQFIIGQDGINGLTYEHSPSEGQPIAVMTDYIIDYIKENSCEHISDANYKDQPEKLTFNVDDILIKEIESASNSIDKLVDDLEMNCFSFKSYGKEFIKTQKLSPDSYIQIALQFAFYRLHKTPGAQYESAATRKYIHGRTETIRSCSVESVAFAQAMLDDKKSDAEKLTALKAAVNSHKKYSIEAVNGFGVDRHLLGLKLMALEKGFDIHSLYKDPGYVRSAHMRVSSSQVATKCDGFMCYGPLVDDGYGCCYNPRPYDINFGISAIKSNPQTSALKYREMLEKSLLDMHNLLAKSQKSKL